MKPELQVTTEPAAEGQGLGRVGNTLVVAAVVVGGLVGVSLVDANAAPRETPVECGPDDGDVCPTDTSVPATLPPKEEENPSSSTTVAPSTSTTLATTTSIEGTTTTTKAIVVTTTEAPTITVTTVAPPAVAVPSKPNETP